MRIEGTIHPPAPVGGSAARKEIDDLTDAEMRVINLGHKTPVWIEHEAEHGDVGRVTASWRDDRGRMRMAAQITDSNAEEMIRSGQMRGLSIGSTVHHRAGRPLDGRLNHTFNEVSITEEPRRPGCYIDEIDGVGCATEAKASGMR